MREDRFKWKDKERERGENALMYLAMNHSHEQ